MGRFLGRLLAQAGQPLVITGHLMRRALHATTSHMPNLLPLLPPQPADPAPDSPAITLPPDTNAPG